MLQVVVPGMRLPVIAKFQWVPTLGGECYKVREILASLEGVEFQWAPTLGGECYNRFSLYDAAAHSCCFNGHPPLGVNATQPFGLRTFHQSMCFSGHPPLGVNATGQQPACFTRRSRSFQSAPTLEGECYSRAHFASRERRRPGFNGHPPLGVNATDTDLRVGVAGAISGFNGHPPLGVNAT